MPVRTFYWDPARDAPRGLLRRRSFRIGNAGDLLNRDIIDYAYGGQTPFNTDDDGRRLLLVGSVIHRVRRGDIVAGVGTKGAPIPKPGDVGEINIRGVRGPITYDALKTAGFDVSRISFQADPGLLVKELYPEETTKEPERNRIAFIPHYRDRKEYKRTRGVHIVDIDCEPRALALEIARAELVLTSSLHGLIFAHAIGRPVVLISPIQAEPVIKYQDYVASVGLDWIEPVDLDTALRSPKPVSPAEARFDTGEIALPTKEELVEKRVLVA